MLINRDSIDNKRYKYFKAQGITCASDPTNCSPSVVDKVISGIHKRSTKKVVMPYLKLIALNRTEGIRNFITSFVQTMVGIPGTGNTDADHHAKLYRYSSYTTETHSQNSIKISFRTIDDLDNSNKYGESNKLISGDRRNNVVCWEDRKTVPADSGAGNQLQMDSSRYDGGAFLWRTMWSSKTANNTDYRTISDPRNTSVAVELVPVNHAAESVPSSEKSDSSVLRMIWRNVSSHPNRCVEGLS